MIALRIQYTRPLAGITALITLAACSSDLTGGNISRKMNRATTILTVAKSARMSAGLHFSSMFL